ncbi:MAG TPA: NAD(P)H-binding protein [Blastocatellia bacterium]|nr:NAD(P)H-binding protein [Blastocatellia bacterium]
MSILISTPTGNIGNRALQQLLNAGADVSIIVRNPEKLSDSILSRVKVHQGSLTDTAFVTKAFQGAQAVLWVTPTDVTQPDAAAYYRQLGETAATAIKQTSVPYVVNISSAGAQLDHAGPISGLGQIERLLNDVAENVIHLRPGFFMENFLADLESIKTDGVIYSPYSGKVSFPVIATKDIGNVAAELLLRREWSGQSIRGLHGSADLRFTEVAEILSDSLGKPVRHVEITPEQAYQAYLSFGVSPSYARAYVEMAQALTQPGAVLEKRTPETTTPTTLREWSDAVLKPLFIG